MFYTYWEQLKGLLGGFTCIFIACVVLFAVGCLAGVLCEGDTFCWLIMFPFLVGIIVVAVILFLEKIGRL